jgi:nucleotide-binding universal stress UspA family protein
MAIKDILLALTSYPEPSWTATIDRAIQFASAADAKLSAIACEVRVAVPGNVFGDSIIDVSALAAAEAKKSRINAETLLATFEHKAKQHDVFHERIFDRCLTQELPALLVDYARLRDLTVIGVPEHPYQEHWFTEQIIFGSGRPTLVVPATAEAAKTFALDHAVVAWDFSRPAARAVADALPLLVKAQRVSVLTVADEKRIDSKRSAEELARHLAFHGATVILDGVDAAGRAIGEVLEAYVKSVRADLLVMGAYGHSRLWEFVLGGATRSILSKPPLPVLLSH